MLQQCLDHAESNNLIPDYQSAYRPFHSCETSLLELVNNILVGMENPKITALVVMDLPAALNTVPHYGLLEVLNCKFGLEGTTVQWIKNYLRPRFFSCASIMNIHKQKS